MMNSMALPLLEKRDKLSSQLRLLPSLIVAYSGGVDSAYLMHAAFNELGDNCRAVIADSPSLPRHELDEAIAVAKDRSWPIEVIQTEELENPEYSANPVNRCYFCKQELFLKLQQYAAASGILHLAYGENTDDASDFRPGRMAATAFSVLAPLSQAGLTKSDIRNLSRAAGLSTADKIAQPCLASRLPTGQPVTREALARIEAGENILRRAGFHVYRLRNTGPIARVQVAQDEMSRLEQAAQRGELATQIRALGFDSVEFDPQGYQGPSLR
jgi:uncharacterized protein